VGRKLSQTPGPFSYPRKPHVRRHGRSGYLSYEPYRPWLRDEFSFRCVFCLIREQWTRLSGIWDIDHLIPQSHDSSLTLHYENLVYVCRTCNAIKSAGLLPNPSVSALGRCLRVYTNGSIKALNDEGRLIINILRLDSDDHTRFRRLILGVLRSFEKHDKAMLSTLLCYPAELPDLSRLRPPLNTKPSGILKSCYARRTRGELPEIY
jgi:hypothetical protein